MSNQRRWLAGLLAVAVLASALTCGSLSVFADASIPTAAEWDTSMTLYQVGNQLKNGKGEVVRLLGVNVPHYCWSLEGDNDAEPALEIALNDWQCNCIRLAVKPSFWLGLGSTSASQAAAYRERIDAFIERVAEAGKYVVLDNHSFYLPGEDSELFWADAAERYKNHPNVIFGLFNEPANCTWKQFYEGAENYTYVGTNDWGQQDSIELDSKGVPNLLKIVRATGAKNLVTISGLTWGFDLEYMTEQRFRGFAYDQAEEKIKNNELDASEKDAWVDTYVEKYGIRETTGNGILFETHPYPDRKDWDTHLLDTLREFPVLVGECGPTKLKDGITSTLDAEETAYMDQLTAYMDKHGMHLTAWAMGAWPHLVYTTDYSRPSAYGQIIKEYIIANVNEDAGGSSTDPDQPDGSGETPVNLLTEHMESIKSVQQDKTTGAVTDSTKFNDVLTTLTDGIISTKNADISSDKWAVTGSETPKAGTANEGVQITLDKAYTLSSIRLYQGISSHPDYVRVYASEKLEDLYKESSLVADDAKTTGLLELETAVKAQYIAVFVTKTTIYNIARVRDYLVMGLENTGTGENENPGGGSTTPGEDEDQGGGSDADDPSGEINLLEDHMVSIKSVQQDKTTGAVTDSTKFDAALKPLTNGDTTEDNTDIHSSLWAVTGIDTPKAGTYNEGVQITLDKAYTLSKIQLYQGISSHPDYVRVYASEKLEDLYKESSLVADDAKTTGLLELNTTVKAQYIAILVTKTTIYDIARVKEYVVLGTESTGSQQPADAVNLIDKIAYVEGIVQFISNGVVSMQSNPFGAEQSLAMYDGDTTTHVDVNNSTEWTDMPRYAGVLMTLSTPVEAEKAVLYCGLSNYGDVLKVYASDSLDTLYTDANLMGKDLPCNGSAVTVDLKGKTIQYMAVILTDSLTGTNWRPKEFEIWGKATATTPAEDKTALENAITVFEPAIAAHGATISSNSENNILFKSKFTKVLQRSCGYTLKEYGILIIPEQFITEGHQNYKQSAELTYGNTWVATASYTVAEGEVLKANEEFSAELRGSSQGVYPGVNFAYRGYAIYRKEGCEDVILYSGTTVRSVWGVARAIAAAILQARDSDGLDASITYTETLTEAITANTLSTVASEAVYAFICKNVAAVTEVASKQ